ncbi:Probable pectinesterase/pectinesterase inhibitor 51 [Ancistrocladus abbreviatus]
MKFHSHNSSRTSINTLPSKFSSLLNLTLGNSNFLLLTMASFLSLTLFSLYLFFTFSSSTDARRHYKHPHFTTPTPPSTAGRTKVVLPEIQRACKGTRYPETCQAQLAQSGKVPPNPTALQIIQSAYWASAQNLNAVQSMVQNIVAHSADNTNRSDAAKTCLEVLGYSEHRTSSTVDALLSSDGRIKDARAWGSAVLAYQYDCWSALKYVNDSQLVNETMSFIANSLLVSTSNALSMTVALDLFGSSVASWAPPKTERNGFWESGSGSASGGLGFSGEFPSGLRASATVCKEGGGCYKTVQEAVDAAPSNLEGGERFVIHIKEGVYEEIVRVPFEKKNVVFVGDGMGRTVITGSLNTGIMGVTTYKTATVGVLGDGFMATDLTFQNTAGPDAHQAVAFRSDSDLSFIENCEFLGNQDTLYVHSLRQLYKSCHIEGNVDFIFGNAAAIFQDCTILVRPRQVKPEKGEKNAVTAHGRIDPAQSTGFVFLQCLVNGTDDYMSLYYSKPAVHKSYLGRPWKEYSRTVFVSCTLEALINPDGWLPFSGDFALPTLYYGEYSNVGAGADLSHRVPWSSQIPAEHINAYSVQNFIQIDEWTTAS